MNGIIRCSCGTPIAELEDGVLVIKSKHHGEKHVSHLKLPLASPEKVVVD